jgi:hypothetical protein
VTSNRHTVKIASSFAGSPIMTAAATSAIEQNKRKKKILKAITTELQYRRIIIIIEIITILKPSRF